MKSRWAFGEQPEPNRPVSESRFFELNLKLDCPPVVQVAGYHRLTFTILNWLPSCCFLNTTGAGTHVHASYQNRFPENVLAKCHEQMHGVTSCFFSFSFFFGQSPMWTSRCTQEASSSFVIQI